METSCRKCVPKASLGPLFKFDYITQNSNCMHKILLKIDILKEHYQKALKKLNPTPFNGQDYEKPKGPETNDKSLFR